MALWKNTKKALILDANAILRYLLRDNPQQADKVIELMKKEDILILPEVIAEVVYVLTDVYDYTRLRVSKEILTFFKAINCDLRLLTNAILLFGRENLDFVDCILYQYAQQWRYEVFTFDEKLNKVINGH
jgi:predicted nucleic acid-binding protein